MGISGVVRLIPVVLGVVAVAVIAVIYFKKKKDGSSPGTPAAGADSEDSPSPFLNSWPLWPRNSSAPSISSTTFICPPCPPNSLASLVSNSSLAPQDSSKAPVATQDQPKVSVISQDSSKGSIASNDSSKTSVASWDSSKASIASQNSSKASVASQDSSVAIKISSKASSSSVALKSPIAVLDPSKTLRTLLDPSAKYNLKLVDKQVLSHDSRRFRFALPSPDHVLGLPVGQHVYLSATVDGKTLIRAYTPVSAIDEKGHMDLVVKIYFKNVNPKFPEGGKFSQYLDSLKIKDGVDVRGPTGSLLYREKGLFEIKKDKKLPATEYKVKRVGMIAAGTGITPIFQLVQHVLKRPEDETELSLVYANRTEEDILLRKELEDLVGKHPARFRLWYTLSKPPKEGWKYSSGHVDNSMIEKHLPRPSDDVIILMCGPDALINLTCVPILKEHGYKNHYAF